MIVGILPRCVRTAGTAFPRLESPGQQELEMLKSRAFLREYILEECLKPHFVTVENNVETVCGLRLLKVGCISPNASCSQRTCLI